MTTMRERARAMGPATPKDKATEFVSLYNCGPGAREALRALLDTVERETVERCAETAESIRFYNASMRGGAQYAADAIRAPIARPRPARGE